MRRNRIVRLILIAAILAAVVLCALFTADGSETGGFRQSAWALLPPVIAIALALITKEVYSSLLIGIVFGGLLYSNFDFEGTVIHVLSDGVATVLSDRYNVGILIFLVILGAMVSLMNRVCGVRTLGIGAYQDAGRRTACDRCAWCADFHRRLFQLSDRRERHASRHGQAQYFPREARVSD